MYFIVRPFSDNGRHQISTEPVQVTGNDKPDARASETRGIAQRGSGLHHPANGVAKVDRLQTGHEPL